MMSPQSLPNEASKQTIRLSLDDLSILYNGSMQYDAKDAVAHHVHEYCEILYVLSGYGKIDIEGVIYPLKTGDLVVISPGMHHHEMGSSDTKMNLVFLAVENFSVQELPKNHLIAPHMPPVISGKDYHYKIESYFTDIISESADHILLSGAMKKSLASALLILILRLYHSREARSADRKEECRRIKDYIDKNYTSPITLDSLSEQIYISKYYLSHIFKSQTGTSPIKYLISKRMDKAAQLLTDTDLSIRDIALRVGYDDPVYFSQMFKKMMNASPAAYRSSNKK